MRFWGHFGPLPPVARKPLSTFILGAKCSQHHARTPIFKIVMICDFMSHPNTHTSNGYQGVSGVSGFFKRVSAFFQGVSEGLQGVTGGLKGVSGVLQGVLGGFKRV